MPGSGLNRRSRLPVPPVRGLPDDAVSVREMQRIVEAIQSQIDRMQFGRVGWKVLAGIQATYETLPVATTQIPFTYIDHDSSHFTNRRSDEDMLFVEVPPGCGGQYVLGWSCEFYELVSNTTTYLATNAVQTLVVPADVHFITVDASGAGGGGTAGGNSAGGKGTRIQGVMRVTPGETLAIHVGTAGGSNNANAYPNGGKPGVANNVGHNGGGSTSIQPTGTFLTQLPNAWFCAGGGGGGGDIGFATPNQGGNAGGITGSAEQGKQSGAYIGTAATTTSGGTGTAGGGAGTFGQGGDGQNSGAVAVAEGGGGGGGWYGGGASGNSTNAAGAGGGSSYANSSKFSGTITVTTGYRAAQTDGYATLTYYTTLPVNSDKVRGKLYVARRFGDDESAKYSVEEIVSEDGGYSPVNGSALVELDDGDRVFLKIVNTAANAGYYLPRTWMAGYRVGFK